MGTYISRTRFTCITAVVVGTLLLSMPSAQADDQAKWDFLNAGGSAARVAINTAGNGIYQVHVQDSGGSCGTWTATTGATHPAGAGLNVLFGNGNPGTSNSTLRSYTSGTDYVTGSSGGCTAICSAAGPPIVTPIINGATTVGFRLKWSIVDAGNAVDFIQEVVVEGPVNGTETVDNTVIRETHIVDNHGPGSLQYGLRKHWDWQIGPDDGPWFGDCGTPAAGCDTSMNLTASGALDGPYPQSYVINDDPASATCPGSVAPKNAAGCTGAPLYIVAGTVKPPSVLTPPPDAPELLQFNEWAVLSGNCWQPALSNNALCGDAGFPSDDTAAAYFYGATAGTAETLAAGAQKSFTQYVVAAEESCPEIIEPTVPTVSQWGIAIMALLLLIGGKVYFSRRRATQA